MCARACACVRVCVYVCVCMRVCMYVCISSAPTHIHTSRHPAPAPLADMYTQEPSVKTEGEEKRESPFPPLPPEPSLDIVSREDARKQAPSSSITGRHLGTASLRGRLELEGAMRTGTDIYICMYTHTHIHTYTHILHTYTRIHTHMHTYTHTHIDT